MCSDVSHEAMTCLMDAAAAADAVRLARELRTACADYRSLALHAGLQHHLSLEAKRRIEHINAKLYAEANLPNFV